MIDRGHKKLPFRFVASVLAALLACTAARANGDHSLRLPPPDPRPALAKIEATPEVTPQPPLPEPPKSDVVRESGQAIFSPFSASAATGPSNAVVQPAASNGADLTFTVLGVLGCLAAGGYLWQRARRAS